MPNDPDILSNAMPGGRGLPGRTASPPIPSFGMLPRGSMLQRMKSNFAECITAPPKGITEWRFAAMFRSAYLPKKFPTRPLLHSILLHVCALTYLTSGPSAPAPRRVADEVETARAENRIIYYTPADRLPPVSPTEPPRPEPPRRPEPQPQRIRIARGVERVISRPPRPDNSRQTIVQPEAPELRLPTEVEIPNIVAWAPLPPPRPSVSETQQQLAEMRVPRMPVPMVDAPAPPNLRLPEVAVPVAPAAQLPNSPVPPRPSVTEAQRQVAQLRMPRLAAPAVEAPIPAPPKLTLPEAPVPAAVAASLPNAPIPPRPSVTEAQRPVAQVRVPQMPNLVAVGVAPAPPPARIELSIPLGNRSGEFAVSPNGEESDGVRSGPRGPGDPSREAPPLPSFPRVGEVADIRVPNLAIEGDRTALSPPPVPVVPDPPEPRAEPVRSSISSPLQPAGDLRTLMARATRPALIPEMTRGRAVETEPEAFGSRRVYTVYINMPNLASGAGSWILRFAERDGDGTGEEEISSPVAVRKVDPQYTPQAARERVEGTVTLAAQILRSGKVTSVKVVESLDPRLDLSAVQALTLWQFEPARKKGVPIDLEVLVQIPFRLPAF